MLGVGVSLKALRGSVAAVGGLLDKFTGSAAAYSLRSLSKDTTNVVRVRRSSDNAEADFTAVEVSDGTLLAWVGTGATDNGFVTTWYDQSGNSNDATQATAANQPKIVDAGVLVTENGKAIINFDGSDDFLNVTNVNASNKIDSSDRAVFAAVRLNSSKNGFSLFYHATEANGPAAGIRDNGTVFYDFNFSASLIEATGTASIPLTYQHSAVSDGGDSILFINGSERVRVTETPNTWNRLRLGPTNGFLEDFGNNSLFEFIVYETDQSTNRTGIEQNIASYYGITLA